MSGGMSQRMGSPRAKELDFAGYLVDNLHVRRGFEETRLGVERRFRILLDLNRVLYRDPVLAKGELQCVPICGGGGCFLLFSAGELRRGEGKWCFPFLALGPCFSQRFKCGAASMKRAFFSRVSARI